MSLIKFTLKNEHIVLLSNLRWSVDNTIIKNISDEYDSVPKPFGALNMFEEIDLLLNGKSMDINILEYDEMPTYSEEQKEEWLKLYNELPRALEVILQTKSFEPGDYATKSYFRNWEKIN